MRLSQAPAHVARDWFLKRDEEVQHDDSSSDIRLIALVVMLVLLAMFMGQPTQSAQAADPHVAGAMRSVPAMREVGIMASGAAEDTLKACMARIPDVASTGQRLLAEQSCTSDEQARKAIRSAPKF